MDFLNCTCQAQGCQFLLTGFSIQAQDMSRAWMLQNGYRRVRRQSISANIPAPPARKAAMPGSGTAEY